MDSDSDIEIIEDTRGGPVAKSSHTQLTLANGQQQPKAHRPCENSVDIEVLGEIGPARALPSSITFGPASNALIPANTSTHSSAQLANVALSKGTYPHANAAHQNGGTTVGTRALSAAYSQRATTQVSSATNYSTYYPKTSALSHLDSSGHDYGFTRAPNVYSKGGRGRPRGSTTSSYKLPILQEHETRYSNSRQAGATLAVRSTKPLDLSDLVGLNAHGALPKTSTSHQQPPPLTRAPMYYQQSRHQGYQLPARKTLQGVVPSGTQYQEVQQLQTQTSRPVGRPPAKKSLTAVTSTNQATFSTRTVSNNSVSGSKPVLPKSAVTTTATKSSVPISSFLKHFHPSAGPRVHYPSSKTFRPETLYFRGFGKVGGDFGEESYEGRFKCEWELYEEGSEVGYPCNAILPSNISFAFHQLSHVLHEQDNTEDYQEEERDSELEASSRCDHCFNCFETPKMMMDHVEAVHKPVNSNKASAPVCFICEVAFKNMMTLQAHMAFAHNLGKDAPYVCRICKFRSSLYEDLRYHFLQEHGKSTNLLCPFCLQVFDCSLPKNVNRKKKRTLATAGAFARHMRLHLDAFGQRGLKCNQCRLWFVKDHDIKKHMLTYHRPDTSRDMKPIPLDVCERPIALQRLERWKLAGRRLLRPAFKELAITESNCIECRQPMTSRDHYRRQSTCCAICNFKSSCNPAWINHMEAHARGKETSAVFKRFAPILTIAGRCDCGFSSKNGNTLAEHLSRCEDSMSTAYFRHGSPSTRPIKAEKEDQIDEASSKTVVVKNYQSHPPVRELQLLKLQPRVQKKWWKEEVTSDDDDEAVIQQRCKALLERKDMDLKNRLRGNNIVPMLERQRSKGLSLLSSFSAQHHQGHKSRENGEADKNEVTAKKTRKRKRSASSSDYCDSDADNSDQHDTSTVRSLEKKQMPQRGHATKHGKKRLFSESAWTFVSKRAHTDELGQTYKKQREAALKAENGVIGTLEIELETFDLVDSNNRADTDNYAVLLMLEEFAVRSVVESLVESVSKDVDKPKPDQLRARSISRSPSSRKASICSLSDETGSRETSQDPCIQSRQSREINNRFEDSPKPTDQSEASPEVPNHSALGVENDVNDDDDAIDFADLVEAERNLGNNDQLSTGQAPAPSQAEQLASETTYISEDPTSELKNPQKELPGATDIQKNDLQRLVVEETSGTQSPADEAPQTGHAQSVNDPDLENAFDRLLHCVTAAVEG